MCDHLRGGGGYRRVSSWDLTASKRTLVGPAPLVAAAVGGSRAL